MQLGGAGIRTSNLLITRRPALPPELQPPYGWKLSHYKSAPLGVVLIGGISNYV